MPLYVCMYVCMYVCIFVCPYVRMHACMHVCVCMYVCMYVQREQPEKVTISTKTCHSLYAKSVDEYVCQAQA